VNMKRIGTGMLRLDMTDGRFRYIWCVSEVSNEGAAGPETPGESGCTVEEQPASACDGWHLQSVGHRRHDRARNRAAD